MSNNKLGPLTASPFNYFGSDSPVRVGDRILVRSLFGRSRLATVIYIPGQSEFDRGLGDDQWAYKLDNGNIYAAGFFPGQFSHPGKRIEFVSRPGEEADEVIRAYRIPAEEPEGQPGRDFLALIGCGALVAIAAALLISLCVWLLGRA